MFIKNWNVEFNKLLIFVKNMQFISYYTQCLEMKMQYLNKPLELLSQNEYFLDNGIREVNSIKDMKLQAYIKNRKSINDC